MIIVMIALFCFYHAHTQDHRLALSGHIPGKDFPYSDHEGVEATFELYQREIPVSPHERVFNGKNYVCMHLYTCNNIVVGP